MREKLNEWWANHIPDDILIFRNGLEEQCVFVRGEIAGLFLDIATDISKYKSYTEEWDKEFERVFPYVIGTHYSKSVKLPVMELDLSKIGMKIILRCNMYDWCISVESKREVVCDFLDLETNREGYFEGFPKNRIYAAYSKNNRNNFSICLKDKYEVYMFMRILRKWAVDNFKNDKE